MSASYRITGLALASMGGLVLLYLAVPAVLERAGIYFFFGVVMTVGMLHGSFDYELEMNSGRAHGLAHFLVMYLAQMMLVALVWVLQPALAMGLFLLFTAWHFGETDLYVFGTKPPPWLVLLYGTGLVGWLFGSHMPDIAAAFTNLNIWPAALPAGLSILGLQNVVVALAGVLILAAVVASGMYKQPRYLVILGVILLATWYLPLLVGFTVYFGFWHALQTLAAIRQDLAATGYKVLRQAMPYFLISLIGGVVSMMVLSRFQIDSALILLIFISSLTLPHARVMHAMFRRN